MEKSQISVTVSMKLELDSIDLHEWTLAPNEQELHLFHTLQELKRLSSPQIHPKFLENIAVCCRSRVLMMMSRLIISRIWRRSNQ